MKKINKILSIMLFLSITSPTLALYDYNLNNYSLNWWVQKVYTYTFTHSSPSIWSVLTQNLYFSNYSWDFENSFFHLQNINCYTIMSWENYNIKFILRLEKSYDGINDIRLSNFNYSNEANYFYKFSYWSNERIFITRLNVWDTSKPNYGWSVDINCSFKWIEYINGLPTTPTTPTSPTTPTIEKNIFIDIQNYILAIFSWFLGVLVVLIPLYYGFKASKYFLTNKLNFLFFNKKKND